LHPSAERLEAKRIEGFCNCGCVIRSKDGKFDEGRRLIPFAQMRGDGRGKMIDFIFHRSGAPDRTKLRTPMSLTFLFNFASPTLGFRLGPEVNLERSVSLKTNGQRAKRNMQSAPRVQP
jgi:hypothetical protein